MERVENWKFKRSEPICPHKKEWEIVEDNGHFSCSMCGASTHFYEGME